MTRNSEVSAVLKEIAILLEVEGKDKFKPRAYYRAVRTVGALGEDIEAVARRDELISIPGVGKGIAGLIKAYLETGQVEILDSLRTKIPVKVMELEAIPGLGPKKIKLLYDEIGVTDLDSMEKAAEDDRISGLKGMGKKTQDQIIAGIQLVRSGLKRTLYADAQPIVDRILAVVSQVSGVRRAEVAGSFRRRRETIGDIDILVDADKADPVMDAFVGIEDVIDIIARGPTKSSVRLKSNLSVDLRVLPADSFGAGMQYFTGNVDHNVQLRAIARKKKLRLNEYGLFKGEEKEKIEGEDEEGIYEALGMAWIPPELRESTGEVDAAQKRKLPSLLELKDIRGDLHSHTDQSDGSHPIEEMLDAADAKGYAYYCVSDHTQSLTIANGMDEARLLKRIDEIDDLNASGRWKMKILKGAEVDILSAGELDIQEDVLEQLDVVTASIHSRMKDDKQTMTERVCNALETKYVHILGHPTGRLIHKRPEFEIDLEQVFEASKANNVAMELNAHPQRLDLNAGNLRAAIKLELKIVINTDAHKIYELDNMKFGVYQARRGWVTKDNVLNTYPLKKLLKTLKK
ncbi:MAG: DNA polymerase/3'-5' exonuclease PolX [Candidatus Thorarchaeota archaeon]|nr:DNA polymerase/3'-5' exonuclease PolX [Candidatus Thorarchaeota archaeon]